MKVGDLVKYSLTAEPDLCTGNIGLVGLVFDKPRDNQEFWRIWWSDEKLLLERPRDIDVISEVNR